MNVISLQILKHYFTRSWVSTGTFFCSFAFYIWLTIREPGYSWLLVLSYAVTAGVSTKLKSTRTYALAFCAPNYRLEQLNVGLSLIFVLGWLPLLIYVHDIGAWMQVLAFLLSTTGFILLSAYSYPKWFLVGPILFISLILLLVISEQMHTYVWNPGLALSLFLILIGTIQIVVFVYLYLAGHEYEKYYSDLSSGGLSPKGSQWVRNFPNLSTIDHQMFPNKPSFNQLEKVINRAKLQKVNAWASSNSVGHFGGVTGRLLNVAVGDWKAWRFAKILSLAAFPTLILFSFTLGSSEFFHSVPLQLTAVIFGIQIITAVETVSSTKWPLASIWVRVPVSTKSDLLKGMYLNLWGNVLKHFGMACALALLLGLIHQRFDLMLIFIGIAFSLTCFSSAIGLLLRQFEIPEIAMALMALLLLAFWFLFFTWVFAPLPFTNPDHIAWDEQIWTFLMALNATAVILILAVSYWWYNGFFERRGNLL